MEIPQPSPLCSFTQKVGLTDIEIAYSRPGAKGRKVFGEVVPFDKVWRTGANQSTKIGFNHEVKINGHTVPPGKYALLTIPGKEEWTVMLSKGIEPMAKYDEKNDQLRIKVKPTSLSSAVETFTIELRDFKDTSAALVLEWEKTQVALKVEVEVMSKVMPEIDKAMAAEKVSAIDYFRAAIFYLNNDQDVNKASEWVDKGLAQKSDFQWLLQHAKARVLAKKGDKAGAVAAAKEGIVLAEKAEGPNGQFTRMNNDVIAANK